MSKSQRAVLIAVATAFFGVPANAMPVASPFAPGVAAVDSKDVARVHYRGWHYRHWAVWPPRDSYLPWWGFHEIPRYYWDVYTVPYGYYYVSPYSGW
jgi:hypothetical protein